MNTTDEKQRENNIVLSKLSYKPLTRRQELSWIKKAKLSYYYKVDKETQKKYLSYYFDEFLSHRRKYEQLLNEINSIVDEITTETSKEKLQILRQNLTNKEQEREELLQKYIDNSRKYRDSFIANNQRLVMSIAGKKQGFSPLDELVSEGNLGMMRALEKFDVEAGTKFSTYATWWIKQYIQRFIMEKQRVIRIPVHREEKLLRLKAVKDKLTKMLYREPTLEELSVETGYSLKIIEELLEDDIQLNGIVSLNRSINDEEDSKMEMFLGEEDTGFDEVDSDLFINYFLEAMDKANLSQKEQQVIIMRYGLLDGIPHTLGEIGEVFNVSRERIRQIEVKALHKIKKNINVDGLSNNYSFEGITNNDSLENRISELCLRDHLSSLEISKRLNIPVIKVMSIIDEIYKKNRNNRNK